MEDSHIAELDFTKDCSLFGVFDGHGGKEVSEFARRHFVERLLQNENFKAKNFALALRENFMDMDTQMQTEAGQKELFDIKGPDKDGKPAEFSVAGCTANVCLVHEKTLYCANSGDSRAVLSRNGRPEPLSYDHKPDDEWELNRIHKAGGRKHSQKMRFKVIYS